MKLSSNDQESIVQLLTRIYMDICPIEEEYQLLAGDHDYRARIDYFHDAIRAFTQGDPKAREAGGRLTVEQLSYDVAALRYIESMPLAKLNPKGEAFSPKSEMVEVKPGLVATGKRPDRNTRDRLSELYQHYAVLFAALLKPFADTDLKDRVEDLNEDIREINSISDEIKALAAGKISADQLAALAQHVNEEALRRLLLTFIQQQKQKDKQATAKLLAFLNIQVQEKDKAIKTIEEAHLHYALSQLAIFENSKDLLKKLATQGANIVGKFVEDAISKAQREIGR